MRLRFSKYEGLGNDFVVVNAEQGSSLTPSDAERLCDRRRGIGADGVLLLLPPKDASAVARMRVLNADGSTPEMCGNGLRCVALHLARERGAKTLEAIVETDAGPRGCSVSVREIEGEADVLVDMGEVRALGSTTLEIDGQTFELHLATAGNPHAIWFCDSPLESAQRFGLSIATHPTFPEGTNVGFAHLLSGAGPHVDFVVWERGVGLTLACGTGACAVGVVARARGLVPPGPITVRLPGGMLEIDPDPKGRTRMRGPARLVYEGILA